MMPTAITSALRQAPIFAGLEDSQLRLLAERCRRRQYRADETLFREGDTGQVLYLILSGLVTIQTLDPSGETVFLASRGAGEAIGELSLIDGQPRMADAITAEPCELLLLDRTEFLRCITESPRIAINVMQSLAARLREAAEQLERLQGLSVQGRVADTLYALLRKHGRAHPSGGKRIEITLTHEQIAQRVGATRESATRSLSALKDAGIVRKEGRMWIVMDEEGLRQHATGEASLL